MSRLGGMRSGAALLAAGFGTGSLRRAQAMWGAAASGNWGFFIVLSLYAYDAGGAAAVGVAAFARLAPAGLAAPFTSLLADRHSRRDVLLVSQLACVALLLAITAAVSVGAPLAAVLALSVAFTMATTAMRPAYGALLPELARSPQQLAAANAVWNMLDNLGFLAGSVAAGLIVAGAGLVAGFGSLAAMYALGVALTVAVPRDPRPAHREPVEGARVVEEALSGARDIARDTRLRLVLGFSTALSVIDGCLDVLLVLVALELLDAGQSGVGWLNGGWAAGGIAGGAVALVMLRRGRLAAGLGLGSLMVGGALVGIGAWPTLDGALMLLAVLGVGFTLVEIAGASLLQRLASDEVLARAFGVMETAYVLATALGSLLAPALVAALGIQGTLLALGGVLAALVVATRAPLGRLEAGVVVPEREYAVLRRVPLFAPLPPALVEALALRVETVPVAGGEVVVRQGEPGDRFYVVDAGVLDVERDGERIATCAEGDCFGEIALLRDVPRTATVRARGPGALLALERDDFLESIGAHPRSVAAAGDMVGRRLARAGA